MQSAEQGQTHAAGAARDVRGQPAPDAEAAGRAMVRAGLIDRLCDAGLQRPLKVRAGGFAVMCEALVARLAYLSPENLETLADVILTHAAAQPGTVKRWPAEVLVVAWAGALQRRPFEQSRIASSWLRSIEGPQAEAAGYLPELYRWLRRHGRPPLPGDLRGLRETAAENARRADLVRGRIARDVAQPEDRDWLAAWLRDAQEARDFVAAGMAGRAAQVGSEGVAA